MSAVAKTIVSGKFETVPGVPLGGAYRVLYVTGAEFPTEDDTIEYIGALPGTWVAHQDAYQMERTASFDVEAVANFDELGWWAHLALGVPVLSGAGPYTRTWTAGAITLLRAATIWVIDNVLSIQMPFGLIKDWEISGGDGSGPKPIEFKASMIGAGVTNQGAVVPTVTYPSQNGQYMMFRNTRLYVNSTAATIGTTAVDCQLMGFSIKCDNKLDPQYPACSTSNGAYSGYEREPRYVELELDLLLNATTSAEVAAYFNNTARYVRLENIVSGNIWRFDVVVKRWASYETNSNSATRRVTLMAQSVYDTTLNFDWRMVLINSVATYS